MKTKNTQIAELRSQLSEAVARNAALSVALDQTVEQRNSLDRALANEQAQVESDATTIDALDETIDMLRDQVADLTRRLAASEPPAEQENLLAHVRAARATLAAIRHLQPGDAASALLDAANVALMAATEIGEKSATEIGEFEFGAPVLDPEDFARSIRESLSRFATNEFESEFDDEEVTKPYGAEPIDAEIVASEPSPKAEDGADEAVAE